MMQLQYGLYPTTVRLVVCLRAAVDGGDEGRRTEKES